MCCAPTEDHTEEIKEQFYDNLESCWQKHQKGTQK